MPETSNIRVCSFSDSQHALEQLYNDRRWYQRGPFFETPEAAEDYGVKLCSDVATIQPRIWRDYDGHELREYHGGHIWNEVRNGLARHRERLIAAFDASSYEAESNLLDDIARKITEQVEPMIQSYNRYPLPEEGKIEVGR
jgi:hypothetical protein